MKHLNLLNSFFFNHKQLSDLSYPPESPSSKESNKYAKWLSCAGLCGTSHANNYRQSRTSPLRWPLEGSFRSHCGSTLFQSWFFFFNLTTKVFFSHPFQRKLNLVYAVDVCHAPPHAFHKIHMTSADSFWHMTLEGKVPSSFSAFTFLSHITTFAPACF